jgi:hypothetical protein
MQSWLANHPNIKRFAVVDDENDGLDGLPLLQPSSKTGLTPDILRGLVRYLSGRTDEDMLAPAVVRLGQNIHALFKRNKS